MGFIAGPGRTGKQPGICIEPGEPADYFRDKLTRGYEGPGLPG